MASFRYHILFTCRTVLVITIAAACQDRNGPTERTASSIGTGEWSVSEPFLTIGQEGVPEYEFENIIGFGRLASGNWVLFDRGPNQLKFYTAQGQFVRSVGRQGEGPGEFRDVLFMQVVDGGTIYTYDQRLSRITVMDSIGRVRNTISVARPTTGSVLRAIGHAGEHNFVFENFTTPTCVEGKVTIDTLTYYTYDTAPRLRGASENLTTVIATSGGSRWGSSRNIIRQCLPQVIPFAPGPLQAVTERALIVVQRAGVSVTLYHFDGPRVTTDTIPIARRPLEQATIDQYVRSAVGAPARDEMGRPLPRGAGMDLYAERLRELPYPDSMPAIDQLLPDSLGYLWIRETPMGTDSLANWLVIVDDGSVVARVPLPAAFRLLAIGADYVAGVQRDSLDIQRVYVRHITRGTKD